MEVTDPQKNEESVIKKTRYNLEVTDPQKRKESLKDQVCIQTLEVTDPQKKEETEEHQEMKFGWKIIIGYVVGFIGAACESIGGVGGGAIFVPMLTLIIGFDAKSSVPVSKSMITGAAVSTMYYNLKRRHPILDMPVIDYNLTLLMQPMLLLGVSSGVILSEVFADWMVTVFLIILFLAMSIMSFFKGVQLWKKETKLKKDNNSCLVSNGDLGNEEKQVACEASDSIQKEMRTKVPILENVYWKELGLLVFVWVAFLILHILKNNRTMCSTTYWLVSAMQIPVSVGVTLYEAVGLYNGKKVIASLGEKGAKWKVPELIFFAFVGVSAGLVGGLLGIGGGSIMGPLFLQLGIPPQVATATATFAMTFSSSMSVVQYYLLKRFPVPYALYFLGVAFLSALVGQHLVRKAISVLGRASIIIFVLVFTIFVSAVLLGGIGIANLINKIEHNAYLGFEKLCA
ncbi:sulfite exporter TauE/SafE family protein 3-like [Papaver somniferum]|uniref:sulfite exporter TauE/SafE family protein 3-like n=1 Tax=Papaver somniferum TaxID=3469 RepID=UPI000E705614|nr:sulfite exporter TauE/SafE family protein 3-like [Papaver somniferum]